MTVSRNLAMTVTAVLFAAAAPLAALARSPVEAPSGMVVTDQRHASEVGAEILKGGGNAVDAAVAVGYALAVVQPCCGNIGGGGFALIRLADGTSTFVNFRERAPLAATETMYLDTAGNIVPGSSTDGYKAVAVPGTVLGLETMREKHGTMSREALIAPAIRLAEEGFILSEGDAALLAASADKLATQPNVAAVFFGDGKPLQAGDRLIQRDLARTLRLIADGGADAFYKGPIADTIVAASTTSGGILSKRDFAEYAVTETPPVHCTYRGYEILSAPPPSSGGTTLCQILNVLEGFPMRAHGHYSAASIHAMVEAMRHAYVDRNFLLGDPAFVDNPVDRLVSKDYAEAIRARIVGDKASSSADVQPGTPPHESTETTHYSILDDDGNAVSVTYTINGNFGAKVSAGDTGFFLNNEMDDFTAKPGAPNMFGLVQGARNAIAPGKRPLSSMSPTIVLRDGRVFMVLGSPGGPRIITIVLQTILDVVDYGLDIAEAMDHPRIHHQWMPDEIAVEAGALPADVRNSLEAMGYAIKEQKPWGSAQAILAVPPGIAPALATELGLKPDMLYGASDPRRPAGAAIGQ